MYMKAVNMRFMYMKAVNLLFQYLCDVLDALKVRSNFPDFEKRSTATTQRCKQFASNAISCPTISETISFIALKYSYCS